MSSIAALSASDPALQTLETSFQQDLNGDGHIGFIGIAASGTTSEALQGGAAVTLLSGPPTITDAAKTTLASATIKIANGSGNPVTGDELYINGQQSGTVDGGLVAVNWNDSTKVLTLTGNDSIAKYQTLLSQITYQDAGTDSSVGSHPLRTVTWSANDGTTNFSTTSQITIDRQPVVTVANLALSAGFMSVAASSLYTASDPDSDTIAKYGFMDTGNGHFVLNGVAQANNLEIDVTAAQLPQLTYQNAIGTDTLQVRANDGVQWGNWASFTVTGPVATVIQADTNSFGSTSLTEFVNHFYLYNSGGSGPSLKYGGADFVAGQFGPWTPIGAAPTASGYEVAWKVTGADAYTVWNTDSSGNFMSSIAALSASDPALQTLETSFQQDLNGDGHIGFIGIAASGTTSEALQGGAAVTLLSGPPTITDAAKTTLASATIKIANGSGNPVTGDELYINGQQSGTVDGGLVAVNWNDSTKVLTLTGNDSIAKYQTLLSQITYQDAGTDSSVGSHPLRTVTWSANDGTTNFSTTSQITIDRQPVVTVANLALSAGFMSVAASSLYTASDPDSDTIAKYGFMDTGNGHFVLNGVAQANNLEIDVTAAQLPQLTYQNAIGTDTLQVRANDGVQWGNWASFTVTGPVATVIQADTNSFGSTSLTEFVNHFYLYNSGGSGPSLKYGGADFVAGQFGPWTPISAAPTASGYEVAWKVTGADAYTVWNTDSSGNFMSSIAALSVSDPALQSLETSFQQDFNGDGVIGSATTVEFSLPTSNGSPFSMALGPDGNVWFTEVGGNQIGRITPSEAITEFAASGSPGGITAGPDGALWYTEISGNKIGRIMPSGATAEFAIPTANAFSHEITTGPDGALWFAEAGVDQIGRITTSGSVTEYALPAAGSTPFDITLGPDGNLWFTEIAGNKIGKITPGGAITEFSIPTGGSSPAFITTGPDGKLWFTEAAGNKIGQITTGGNITEFTIPTANSQPQGIATGPNGTIWFTEASGNKIGLITTDGNISESAIPTASSGSFGIVTGSDGTIWFAEFSGNKIGHSGQAAIGAGATLELAGAGSGSVTFNSSTGTLKLDAPSTFNGKIIGFTGDGTLSGSDHIDLSNMSYNNSIQTNSTYNSSTDLLKVNNGTNTVSLSFVGSYSQANFKFADDGHGGTIIYDPPTASQLTTGSANNGFLTIAAASHDTFVFSPDFGQATGTSSIPAPDTTQIAPTVVVDTNHLLAAIYDGTHGNAVTTDTAHDTITIPNLTLAQIHAQQDGFHFV